MTTDVPANSDARPLAEPRLLVRGEAGGALTRWCSGVWPVVILAAALGVARLAYIALLCPYTLIEDEAHYWEWSRRLDWSYYSKGPGIALAIRAATEMFGTSEWAIRVPAVISASIATLLVGVLAAAVAARGGRPDWRIGFFGAACFQLAPVNQVVGIVSTIDGPFIACWAGACLAAWWALERRSRWAWVALGAAVGVGFLFKYTIVLLPPGLLLYALLRWRGEAEMGTARTWRRWALAGAVVAAIGLAPVVVWNAQQGWPTVRHLLGHIGAAAGDMPIDPASAERWTPRWALEFIGMQLGIVGPALILALVAAVWGVWSWWEIAMPARRAGTVARSAARDAEHAAHHGRLFLVCCAAPVLGFYVLLTLGAEAEGNWAMGAYVTLLALAGWAAAEAMREYGAKLAAWRRFAPEERPWSGIVRRKPETPEQILWHATIAYGLITGVAFLRVDLVDDALARVDGAMEGLGLRTRLAAAAPSARLSGADEMGRHAAEIVEEIRTREGQEPFVVAQHYGRASLLAFYMPGRPVVYCASSLAGGRRTQYDLWADTDLGDPSLLGRPAVLVGHAATSWRRGFREAIELGSLRGDGKRGTRPAFLGLHYTGLPGGDAKVDVAQTAGAVTEAEAAEGDAP